MSKNIPDKIRDDIYFKQPAYASRLLFNFKVRLINIFYTFNTGKRRQIRNDLRKRFLLENSKQIIDGLKKKYADYWIFVPFHCIGDLLVLCQRIKSFKEKFGGKVVIIVKDAERYDLVKSFQSVDAAEIIPEDIFMYLLYEKNSDFSMTPQKGIPHFINPDNNKGEIKFKNLKSLYSRAIGLSENIQNTENPEMTKKAKRHVNAICKIKGLSNNMVFLAPYAASLNWKVLSKDFWLKLAEIITSYGYEPVFNAHKGDFKNYKTIFLPLTQMFPFAEKCKKMIMFRSGLVDLVASYKSDNIITIYPGLMDHPDLGITQRNIWKENYKFDKTLSDEENMYRIFSLKEIIGEHKAKEIIFDGNEENLLTILKNDLARCN